MDENEEQKCSSLAQPASALIQSANVMKSIAKYESLDGTEKPQIDLHAFIEIEEDYILSSHLGDWKTLYDSYTFTADQKSWNLQNEHPVVYK